MYKLNVIKNRFVHLTHDATREAFFASHDDIDVEDVTYTKLVGDTAEEAEFTSVAKTELEADGLHDIVVPSCVVFVDFPDGTTGIISHNKFYSKLDGLRVTNDNFTTPRVVVLSEQITTPDLPTESDRDLGLEVGDIVIGIGGTSGVPEWATAGLLVDMDKDAEGDVTHYSWITLSQPYDRDWAEAQTALA